MFLINIDANVGTEFELMQSETILPDAETSLWGPAQIEAVTGGNWLRRPPPGWAPDSVTYHMSSVRPGTFFIAMDRSTWPGRPMRITGHARLSVGDRLREVARLSASGAMIQSDAEAPPDDLPLLRVSNTRVALRQLAFDARNRFCGKVIAVTGTVGKTTTKEMLWHVLSRQGPTLATLGSRNTIDDTAEGLAMLQEEYGYAVLEMAVSSFHRVRRMPASKLARSHVAIITEVDAAHLEIYKTIERVVDCKTKIFDGLEPGGTAVLNRDSAVFGLLYAQARRRNPGRIITFGTDAAADCRLVQYDWTNGRAHIRVRLDGHEMACRLPLLGLPMARNSLAVLAATMANGADVLRSIDDLADFGTVAGRLEVVEIPINGGSVTLIDDSDKSNPASMQAGLASITLVNTETSRRRIVVLGEMKGLGPESAHHHAELASAVLAENVDGVLTLGKETKDLRAQFPQERLGSHTESPADLFDALRTELHPGDVVLVKGSHDSRASEVTQDLKTHQRASELLLNVETRQVLYEHAADAPRYPASLVMLMTLYLVFEALDHRRLEINDMISVSAEAARPRSGSSILGLAEGDRVSVEEAIRGLIVRSANDVAVALAERIGGAEARFVRCMNMAAASLGLSATVFTNASGLHSTDNQTTAREMAKIAVGIIDRFPHFLHYFAEVGFTYHGKYMRARNRLLGEYPGLTGMKTGHTRRSGYHLVATARRDQSHLLSIVMGARNRASCDDNTKRLLDLGFAATNQNAGGNVAKSQMPQPPETNEAETPLWTAAELAAATRGAWQVLPPPEWFPCTVTYNLGSVRPGAVFITTDKPNWEKHARVLAKQEGRATAELLREAARAGAVGAITRTTVRDAPPHLPLLLVSDTHVALWDLGRTARDRFRGKVVAVTGSVGKSTTKDMVRHVLARHGRTNATTGNWNTMDGLAMSLAQTPAGSAFAVYELAHGSMTSKTRLARPHVAIVTEIGLAHLDHFRTLESITDHKAKIFDGLQVGGVAVLNRDTVMFDRLYAGACVRRPDRIITFGSNSAAEMRLTDYTSVDLGGRIEATFEGQRFTYMLPIPGIAMARNSLGALTAVAALGVDPRRAAEDLADFRAVAGRLDVVSIPLAGGSVLLIDDSFNANPSSMRAGLSVLGQLQPEAGGRRIVVLGEMKELGDESERFHAELAPAVMQANVNLVLTTGDHMRRLRDGLPKDILGPHVQSPRQLCEIVQSELRAGDVVLVKGSHASNVYTVSKYLRQHDFVRAKPREAARKEAAGIVVVSDCNLGLKPNRPSTRTVTPVTSAPKSLQAFAPLCDGKAVSQFDAIFLGDTSFGDNYQQNEEERGRENILKTRGYDYSLAIFAPLLARANLVIANLETPVTNLVQSPFAKTKSYVHWTDVVEAPRSLCKHNISVVNLANNHSTDFGEAGFEQTLNILGENGIKYIGAGRTITEAERPFLGTVDILQPPSLKSHDFRLAVISAFHFSERYQNEYQAYASEISGGTNPLSESRMSRQIAEIKRAHPSVFVVVMPHWRRDYQWRSSAQAKFANRITAAGADLVIGHGAHMLQELEHVNGRWVANGIGNFVFNSPGRYKAMNAPPFSLIARLIVDFPGRLRRQLRLYPILTDNRVTSYQPRFVTKSEFGEVQALLRDRTNDRTRFDQEISSDFDHYGPYLSVPLIS